MLRAIGEDNSVRQLVSARQAVWAQHDPVEANQKMAAKWNDIIKQRDVASIERSQGSGQANSLNSLNRRRRESRATSAGTSSHRT